MTDERRTDYFNERLGSMKEERSTFNSHYREISEMVQPRRGRFLIDDVNKGDRRYTKIIQSRGSLAFRTARSGLHAGLMSQAKPWFELGTPDPDLQEFQPVKEWLYKVQMILYEIFRQSNLYNMAPIMLGETILFGTGCMLHMDDFDTVARFYTQTVGSYYAAQNHKLQIDTVAREYKMTAGAMARQFGVDKLSKTVKNILERKKGAGKDAWVPVIQFIEPNPKYDREVPFGVSGAYRSVYFEPGATGSDADQFLDQGGYRHFPAYLPRWETTGEDIYGTDCPGMSVLGDINGLQVKEKVKAKGLQKQIDPPLHGPATLRNVPISGLPGGATLYDGSDQPGGLRPIYEVRLDIAGMVQDIEKTERMIDEGFFVDLFKPITNMEGIQPRNELDLSQRSSEALLMLGPVLENFHGEFLTKMVDRQFDDALYHKILPPPPQELSGQALRVNYISTLAMAQRATSAGAIDRLAGFIGGLVQGGLSDGAKFNADEATTQYAAIVGAPPKVLFGDDQVAQTRAQKQKQMQMQQMAEMAQSAANTTKMLSDAKTGDSSALTQMQNVATNMRNGGAPQQ